MKAEWHRTIRAGTITALVTVTHSDDGHAGVGYGWAEVVERAPTGCRLPIPLLTRSALDEAARLGQWPGEQVNLKPGDSDVETLNETLPARCKGALTLSLIMKPASRASGVRRQLVTIDVVTS